MRALERSEQLRELREILRVLRTGDALLLDMERAALQPVFDAVRHGLVGYRAELKGRQVTFALGYSHPVVLEIPAGIDIAVDKQTHVTVTGIDRQLVGQIAANIRRMRKPDPYKQKGVRYTGERVSARRR